MTDDRIDPELAAAMVAALAKLTTVEKGRAAGSRFKYADLGDVVKETRPVLAAEGLVATTAVHWYRDDLLAVTVTLYHRSGAFLEALPLPFPAGDTPQDAGSSMTYYRRYALLAALGMATEDDDGAKATEAAAPPRDPAAVARQRLGKVVHELDEEQRVLLRAWLEEEGLPDRAALMTEEECSTVAGWIADELLPEAD